MLVINNWENYKLLDAGDGEKLERWGDYVLRRPDPQAIWDKDPEKFELWNNSTATYVRSNTGGGRWDMKEKLPEQWPIEYKNLKFFVRPTGFKHTGVFPEQAANWDFMMNLISQKRMDYNRPIKVLNLFGYTGCATVACVKAGAEVCHIDSSKQILTTAKDNLVLSGVGTNSVRFIPEDALSFVKKEIRRGSSYDIILMDPPTFGRGDKGQVWKIEKDLNQFIQLCTQILSDKPLAIIVNAYVSGLAAQTLKNILNISVVSKLGGKVEADDLGIGIEDSKLNLVLPTGIYARWFKS